MAQNATDTVKADKEILQGLESLNEQWKEKSLTHVVTDGDVLTISCPSCSIRVESEDDNLISAMSQVLRHRQQCKS